MEVIDWKKYDGFLFDLDGTLIDSMGIWEDAEHATLKYFTGLVDPDLMKKKYQFIKEYKGNNVYLAWAEQIIINYKINDVNAAELFAWFTKYAFDQIKYVNYKPGAAEFLLKLKDMGKELMLVTMSGENVIEELKNNNKSIITAADFKYIFGGNYVTSNMVKRQKPNHECYDLALGELGLNPDKCLAFEDSKTGILAATGAKLTTCAVYDKHSGMKREEISGLTPYHINSFEELLK